MYNTEAVVRRYSVKKMLLKISQNSKLKPPVPESLFLVKMQVSSLRLSLKRQSDTGVFLCILRDFKNTFFKRTPPVSACDNAIKL